MHCSLNLNIKLTVRVRIVNAWSDRTFEEMLTAKLGPVQLLTLRNIRIELDDYDD